MKKQSKKDKVSKKREKFNQAKDLILANLDIGNDTPTGKLAKNLREARQARDK